MQMSFTIIVLLSLTVCAAVRLCPLGDTVTPLPRLTLVSLGCTVTLTPVVYLPLRQAERVGPLLSARSISMLFCFLFVPPCISSIKVSTLAKLTFCCFSRRPPVVAITERFCCVPKMRLFPVCWPFSVCYSIFNRRFGGGIPAARWQNPCSKLSDPSEVKLTKRSPLPSVSLSTLLMTLCGGKWFLRLMLLNFVLPSFPSHIHLQKA